ncbi:MAG: GNAT family N-acetyltransferase [Bacteroidales bacterium]
MEIKEVNLAENQDFFEVALRIYKNDPNWVAPLEVEIKSLFDKNKNKLLQNGDYKAWVLYKSNIPVGRIIAFWTEKKSKKRRPYEGGLSFFECINNQEAANLLFGTAIQWLKTQNMQVVDAVTIPGENYNYWGVLVEGFVRQGFGMPYNPPYYKELFEDYGFQNYYEQYSYHVDLTKEFPERHVKFAQHILNSTEYDFKYLDINNPEKFAKDITTIFNDVWSVFHADYVPVEYHEFLKILEELKPIIKPKYVWLAYHNTHPVGMAICLPDLNQAIKPFKGKLNLFNKIRLIFRLKKISRARLFVTGVNPKYQRTGLIYGIFLKLTDSLKEDKIKELEMSWVGNYNPKVNQLYKHMGNTIKAKTHVTFRYIIDKNIEFKRFENLKEHES